MTAKANREAKRLQMELPFPLGRAVTDADVWEAVYSHGNQWATRRMIADALGRQVHPRLIERIEALVESGYLEKRALTLRNGAQGYEYAARQGREDENSA